MTSVFKKKLISKSHYLTLESYCGLYTSIIDGLLTAIGHDNGEGSGLKHSRITASACTDCEGTALVAPIEGNRCVGTLLIVIAIAFVLV